MKTESRNHPTPEDWVPHLFELDTPLRAAAKRIEQRANEVARLTKYLEEGRQHLVSLVLQNYTQSEIESAKAAWHRDRHERPDAIRHHSTDKEWCVVEDPAHDGRIVVSFDNYNDAAKYITNRRAGRRLDIMRRTLNGNLTTEY